MAYSGPFPAPVKAGGTGDVTLTNNCVLLGNGTNAVSAFAPATNGQLIIGNTGNPPSLAVPGNGNNITWTTGAGTLTPDLTGTTDHAVQIGNASGSLSSLSVGTNGQVLLGATGADPAFATLTSTGSSITYATGANTLNIDITSPVSIANGGTNATSMATTDGTIYYDGTRLVTTATGTAGQVLTSGGAGVAPSYSSAGATATGWVFISKQTAATSAALTFTTGITATYNNYAMVFTNLIPATDLVTIYVRLSLDGGSNYIATGYLTGNTRNSYNATAWTNGNTTVGMIAASLVHNANIGACAVMYLYNLTSASIPISQSLATIYNSGTSALLQQVSPSIYSAATITVNALQVIASSGNLTSGTVSLFGIKEA